MCFYQADFKLQLNTFDLSIYNSHTKVTDVVDIVSV